MSTAVMYLPAELGALEPGRVRAIVREEVLAGTPVDLDLAPFLEELHRRYGDELVAVVLYGSLLWPELRKASSTPDFVVVTEHGRLRAHGRALRLLHRTLPPATVSAEAACEDGPTIFKYLHVDRAQLAAITGPRLRDLFLAGRLSKQVRVVYQRDEPAGDAVVDAVVSSVLQIAPLVCATLPETFDRDAYVLESLAISYRGEWRIEAPGKVARLAAAAWGYYSEVYGAVLDAQLRAGRVVAGPDGALSATAGPAERRRARAMLRRTRRRAAMRWPKYALTVPHAGHLVASKLERAYPGVRIGPFARRHPLLCAVPLLPWLAFRGALRTAQVGPATRAALPGPGSVQTRSAVPAPARTTAFVRWSPTRPRLALVANLQARGLQRHGFDATAYTELLGRDALVLPVAAGEAIPEAVGRAHDGGAEAIAVLGGDGTLGTVASEILARWEGPLPALITTCGGGNNLVARVLGASRSPLRDLGRMVAAFDRAVAGAREIPERAVRTIAVTDAGSETTRHGFVLGAGAPYEYARRIAERGGSTWWNSARHTMGLTMGAMFGTEEGEAVWHAFPASVSIDGTPIERATFTAICAVAVFDHPPLLHVLPDPEPAEAGTFSYLASGLSRTQAVRQHLIGVLRGTYRGEDHVRGHASALRFTTGCGYFLDGELAAPTETPRELRVEAGPVLRFWVPRGASGTL